MFKSSLSRVCLLSRVSQVQPHSVRTVIATRHATHSEDNVFLSRKKDVVVLSLNRHDLKNSLSRKMSDQLWHNVDSLYKDPEVRVLVIRSTVKGVFCAGADLRERLTMAEADIPIFVSRLRAIMTALHDFPSPTIAAIDGAAIGGGLELALATDLRIASDNAKMGLVETKLAVIPGAGGSQRLPRLVGVPIAKELIFTGRLVNGQEAKLLGLVNECVNQTIDGDAAYRRALELAQEIACNGPIALKMAKLAINKGVETDLATGLALEQTCHSVCVKTNDRVEGLNSFKEKRAPKYNGN